MQELLNSFGVNGFLLAAQIVNFCIVLYLLKRFALKPILKLLENRKKTIAESLQNTEETQKLLEKTEEREKEILKKAQVQAQELLTDARKQASVIQQDADTATKARVERMLEDEQKKIEEQTRAMEKQLATQVTRLSIAVLEKSLKGFFTDKEQKEVIQKATKQIKA